MNYLTTTLGYELKLVNPLRKVVVVGKTQATAESLNDVLKV
jgi:hypothetical protein